MQRVLSDRVYVTGHLQATYKGNAYDVDPIHLPSARVLSGPRRKFRVDHAAAASGAASSSRALSSSMTVARSARVKFQANGLAIWL